MICHNESLPFTADDIPSLDGKVILVTGGNNGLGKQAILELARHGRPAEIWMAARDLAKAQRAADDIKHQVPDAPPIKLLQLDLASLDSVKQAAETFLSQATRLDILMLNAGIMATSPGTTKDGYEIQWATNYLGHAFLTKLLLPILEKTAAQTQSPTATDVRIVSLATYGHNYAPDGGIQFGTLKTPAGDTLQGLERYGQSKLAVILWVRQMAELCPRLTVVAVHPGVVQTNLMADATDSPLALRLGTRLFYRWLTTPEKGARNQLWAATGDLKGVRSGEYYEPVGVGGLVNKKYGRDDGLAGRVWEWTERELNGLLASRMTSL